MWNYFINRLAEDYPAFLAQLIILPQWSRFSGGSGAPFWTLAACGINPRNLTATQSAIIHSEYPLAHDADPASLPAMIWSTNYGRLLSQTVFTLFFAGRAFAPSCIIDGKNIQDYLQEHYIEAMGKMADRIRDVPGGGLVEECVIGWDSLNEPFEGLCGWDDLTLNPVKQGSTLKKGTYPTPAQSLRLGMGQAQTVDNWSFGTMGPSRDGSVTIDPKGLTIWADPSTESADGVHPYWGWKRDTEKWKLGMCIWAQHGVWDVETGFCLRPDYFKYLPETGETVDFIEDYWKPHFIAFTDRIRASQPEAIMFVQPPVFARPPPLAPEVLKGRCAYSGHYYDGLTLVTRHWNWFNADALGLLRGRYSNTLQAVKIGESAIRRSLQEQLGILKSDTEILGDYPTIIGEIGTPFDMDQKRSYGWTDNGKYKGDYGRQEKALDASLNGADGVNGINWTVWTYCADHTHDWGDGWNMEDLSLWSADDLRDREKLGSDVGGEQDDGLYSSRLGASNAVLLRKNKLQKDQATVSVAAASSLSLASLGSMSVSGTPAPPFDEMSIQQHTVRISDWINDPYDFLTDGARAVRAFSRPWPHKVVGVPVNMRFDIGKAFFRLVVGVTADDQPTETEDGELLATEIYVPLVHYASNRLIKRSSTMASTATLLSAELSGHRRSGSVEDQKGGSIFGSRAASRIGSRAASTIDLSTMPSFEGSASTSSTATASPDLRGERPEIDLVDVDVKVSAGRWTVEGQVLKWWYDVPKAGEGKEYTIEIRRRGGVIKGLGNIEELERSWCERMCDEQPGCCIM
jgi:hypothetical protein